MTDIASQTASLTEEAGRSALFIFDSPIFYVIGYVLLVYFTIFFVAVYAGPAIFGQEPYYPYPGYGRNLPPPHRPFPHYIVKRGSEGNNNQNLISRVVNAVENPAY